ncbi:hypothetical protein SAMN04488510_10246 [Fervidobacterium changbaicum]|uniref:Uncharacterized protein n=2 Tax=Fervidobacterium TaxID=2422 RepID=A0AAI8CKT0_FERIS|nr:MULTISPECIES: hypothetical protein [Fervidobacterium]AMW32754.1 hypothetical protein NA23_05335 [Fervidobacterium islandicum]QAV32789.1 hypothetical protein CBS1_02850 [Fervidobacterium changbaicum]SDG95471.1 hypothetical protein SAMN04488510_10246 [Fervidobacterium changbaicum]
MGDCIYCGRPAGLLRKFHPECKERYENTWNTMIYKAKSSALGLSQMDNLENELRNLAKQGYVPEHKIREAIVSGWEEAVQHFLEDGQLDKQEEEKLLKFIQYFGLSQYELDKNGMYTRLVQAAVLRDVLEGKVPQRLTVAGTLPFNFQKNESLVWVFKSVKYYEQRTRREYVGASQGVSIRIARGVYYRVGGFKGYPIEKVEKVHVDTGMLAITTKHIYFHGSVKSFRIPYSKIVSFTPYSDGFGINKDAASAKPQIFETGDGWFVYNLVVNLARGDFN